MISLSLQSKLLCVIALIAGVIQVNSQILRFSEEDKEFDSSDDFIPEVLKNVLTEEVGAYENPLYVQKNFVYYHSGFDDENRPVWVLEIGKWDMKKMIEGGPETYRDFDNFCLNGAYKILNSTQILSTENEPVLEACLLVDMEGFALKQIASFPTLSYILAIVQKLLPAFEKLNTVYVLNTNYVAQTLLNTLKPIMGRDYEKLEVFGSSKAKWIPQILKRIPRDQLPEWYGGVKDFVPYKVYG